jgi:hypothetical protein
MSFFPAPYFKVDDIATNKLDLLNSFSPVHLWSPKGEFKEGTILIGKGAFWYRREDRVLFRLLTLWVKPPELHASIIRLNPRIDLFLETYSKEPEFVLYFADQKSAQLAHASILECTRYPPPPPVYSSVQKTSSTGNGGAVAAPIMGVAKIVDMEKRKIEEEAKLTNEAVSDLSELMNRANEVMDLLKKCAETMSSSHKDIDAFDVLLSEIGVVDNPVTKATAGKKYHQDLAKQISIFLSQRKPPSVVITLPDVYALYNRARGGADLVSPSDLVSACRSMNNLELDFEFLEYDSGVRAVRNKKMYSTIAEACDKLLKAAAQSLSAADLTKAVPSLPLVIAKEWLMEKENSRELVRDKDSYGNIRWYANLYFR